MYTVLCINQAILEAMMLTLISVLKVNVSRVRIPPSNFPLEQAVIAVDLRGEDIHFKN